MNDHLLARRALQCAGLFLLANGLMGLIKPRWHSLLWSHGPELLLAATEELADHPTCARVVYVAEAAVGLALTSAGCCERD